MKSRQIVFLPGLRRSAGGTWKINPAFIPVDSKSTRLSSLLSGTPVPLAVDRNLPAPGSQNKALALRETSRGQMKDGRWRTWAEPSKWGQLRVWDALSVCVCVCVCGIICVWGGGLRWVWGRCSRSVCCWPWNGELFRKTSKACAARTPDG